MTTNKTNGQLGIFDASDFSTDTLTAMGIKLTEFEAKCVDAALTLLRQAPAEQIAIRKLSQTIGCVPSTILSRFNNYQLCWQFVADKCFNYWLELQLSEANDLSSVFDSVYQLAAEQPYLWRLIFEYAPDQAAHMLDHSLNRQQFVCQKISSLVQGNHNAASIWCMLFGYCHLLTHKRVGLANYQQLKADLALLC